MGNKKVEVKIGIDSTGVKTSVDEMRKFTASAFKAMSANAEVESNEISDAFRKMGIRTDAAIKKSTANAKSEYRKIRDSGKASAREIQAAHSFMTAKVKRNNAELVNSTNKITKATTLLSTAFAPIAVAYASLRLGTAVIMESIRFESALLDLQKVLTDAEGDARQFTGTVEDLAKRYGESAVDILQGAANFKQAGFTVNEAFELQEESLKLVIAGNLEAAEASEILVSVLKGFKAPASDAARLVDVLNEISNKYATNVRELAQGMADLSPIAKKMGFTFEETAGLLTPVIEIFRSGSEAAQALRTGLLKIISDEKPVENALRALGVEQKDLNEELRSGKDILLDVSLAFTNLNRNQKLFITANLVGTRQAARMVEVFDGLNKTQEITRIAMAATGSAAREVAIRMAATEKQIDIFQVGLARIAKIVGDELNPSFRKMLSGLTNLLPKVLDLFFKLRTAQLETQKSVLKTIAGFTFWTDLIHLTKGATDTLNDAMATLDEEILKVGESQKRDIRSKEEVNAITKRVAKSAEELTKSINDLASANRKAETEERRRVLTSQRRIDAEVAGIKETKTQQDLLNKSIEESIDAQKSLLGELETEVEKAESFRKSIFQSIEDAKRKSSQAGLTPGEILESNLDFAKDDFEKAQDEFASGNQEAARNLAKSALIATLAITSTSEKLSVFAEGRAKRLQDAVVDFAEGMEAAAKKAIPAAQAELEVFEAQLVAGVLKLEAVQVEIKTAIESAKFLNEVLEKGIEKVVTIRTETVAGDSIETPIVRHHGGSIPGIRGSEVGVIAKAGEYMINDRAVSALGLPAAQAFNRMDVPSLLSALHVGKMQKLHDGGLVAPQAQAQAAPTDTVNLNFSLEGQTFRSTMQREESTRLKESVEWINLTRGRRERKF